MSAEATRAGVRPAARRDRITWSALLCSGVLVCLTPPSAAAARPDPALPDRDLPCNDLCRAWLSWGSERQAAADGRSEPRAEESGGAARDGGGAPRVVLRRPAAVRTRRTAAAARLEPLDAGRLARDEAAPARLKKPSPPRSAPPRRPSALVSTPIAASDAADGDGSRGPDQVAADAGPPRAGAAGRLRSDVDSADAAVLARPLYRPSSATDAPQDGPEAPGGALGRGSEPQVPDPATVRTELRRDDRDATDAVPPPAVTGSTLRVELPDAAIPVADPSPPAPAAANPSTGTTRPSADAPAVRGSPRRTAPVQAVPAPALPTSDLERLDEAKLRGRPVAIAPTTAPAPPTAGALLLGCLAVLSLVGLRRRGGLEGPT